MDEHGAGKRAASHFQNQSLRSRPSRESAASRHAPNDIYSRNARRKKDNLIKKKNLRKGYAKAKQEALGEQETSRTKETEIDDREQETQPASPAQRERSPQIDPASSSRKNAEKTKNIDKSKPRATETRLSRAEALEQRQRGIEERQRHRRAMAKARTRGKDGQRKLGRESKVLLEKVQRLMSGDRPQE